MRSATVRIPAIWLIVCGPHGAVAQNPPLTDQEILEWLSLPQARLATMDTAGPELRAQIEADQRLGFRFERDLNGDGVLEQVVMGTWVQTGDWPHTFLALIDGAGRIKMTYTFFTPSIVGIENADGLSVSPRQDIECVGRIGWDGEHFTLTGLAPECIGEGRRAEVEARSTPR